MSILNLINNIRYLKTNFLIHNQVGPKTCLSLIFTWRKFTAPCGLIPRVGEVIWFMKLHRAAECFNSVGRGAYPFFNGTCTHSEPLFPCLVWQEPDIIWTEHRTSVRNRMGIPSISLTMDSKYWLRCVWRGNYFFY